MKSKTFRALRFPVVSILLGLLIGAVVIVISGENPFTVYYHMLVKPFSSLTTTLNVLYTMTPLIILALAFVVANRAGIVNIGLEGQLLLGSLTAAYLATLFPSLDKWLYVPFIIVCAAIVGGLWAWYLVHSNFDLAQVKSSRVSCLIMWLSCSTTTLSAAEFLNIRILIKEHPISLIMLTLRACQKSVGSMGQSCSGGVSS